MRSEAIISDLRQVQRRGYPAFPTIRRSARRAPVRSALLTMSNSVTGGGQSAARPALEQPGYLHRDPTRPGTAPELRGGGPDPRHRADHYRRRWRPSPMCRPADRRPHRRRPFRSLRGHAGLKSQRKLTRFLLDTRRRAEAALGHDGRRRAPRHRALLVVTFMTGAVVPTRSDGRFRPGVPPQPCFPRSWQRPLGACRCARVGQCDNGVGREVVGVARRIQHFEGRAFQP